MNNTIYRKNFINILLLSCLFLFLYAITIYYLDPLQQYHLATYTKPVYSNEAYQNPGLAKQAHYDSVLIGSSMTENFRSSYINQRLGWQILKLSLSGARPEEENLILNTAIQTGKVKNVIFGVDIIQLSDNHTRPGFPFFLYTSHSMIDNLKYLLNIGNLSFMVKNLLNSLGIHKGNVDLDTAYVAMEENRFSAKNAQEVYDDQLRVNGAKGVISLADMKNNFDTHILAVIKAHPQINFYLFYPPYSVYTYQLLEHKEMLDTFLITKKYIFEKVKNLPNVKLYDFQIEGKITANLNNYCDISHYSKKVADFVTDNLGTTSYLVTAYNINATLIKRAYLQAAPQETFQHMSQKRLIDRPLVDK